MSHRISIFLSVFLFLFAAKLKADSSICPNVFNGPDDFRLEAAESSKTLQKVEKAFGITGKNSSARVGMHLMQSPIHYESTKWSHARTYIAPFAAAIDPNAVESAHEMKTDLVHGRLELIRRAANLAEDKINMHVFRGEAAIRKHFLQPIMEQQREARGATITRTTSWGIGSTIVGFCALCTTPMIYAVTTGAILDIPSLLPPKAIPVVVTIPALIGMPIGYLTGPKAPLLQLVKPIERQLNNPTPGAAIFWGSKEVDASGNINALVDIAYFVDADKPEPIVFVSRNTNTKVIEEAKFSVQ